MEFANSWAVIDLDAIAFNFENVKKKAKSKAMAVIKANGYGHGAAQLAHHLKDTADFFGVSSPAEALELRGEGIENPILILGHVDPNAFPVLIRTHVRVAISTYKDAELLSQAAVALGKTAKLHIAVDTGMSRIGFQVTEEAADTCAEIAKLPGLEIEGLFSHFATADETDLSRADRQAEKFAQFDKMLKDRGLSIPIRHLDNSAGTMNYGGHYDMVRAGIVLYGLYPSDQVEKSLLPLKPAMSWYSRVTLVKVLEPGREINYGGTFVTQRETVAATVSVGYGDGYSRNLSNKFYVLIKGKKAPILGRVCMDQIVVDVTDIPGVKAGDTVTLLGDDGLERITVEDMAKAAGGFHYETVCNVNRRVSRVYFAGGEKVDYVNYLIDN